MISLYCLLPQSSYVKWYNCITKSVFLFSSSNVFLFGWFRQTKIHNLKGNLVGIDKFGNKYYENRNLQSGQCFSLCFSFMLTIVMALRGDQMQERSLHFIILLFVADLNLSRTRKSFFPLLLHENDYTVVGYALDMDSFIVLFRVFGSHLKMRPFSFWMMMMNIWVFIMSWSFKITMMHVAR